MDLYEALYTTRAMRRLRPDPIPRDVQARIMDAAIRAPSGGNSQQWRFLLVDDPDVRNRLGPVYRACAEQLWSTVYNRRIEAALATPTDPDSVGTMKVVGSAQHLADHFVEVPLLLFAFQPPRGSGSSIYPAVWSAMLAARAEGIGTCLTTILAFRDAEVREILGIPADAPWEMACCITMGYPTGRWGIAERQPVHEVTFHNRWDAPPPFTIDAPIWRPEDKGA